MNIYNDSTDVINRLKYIIRKWKLYQNKLWIPKNDNDINIIKFLDNIYNLSYNVTKENSWHFYKKIDFSYNYQNCYSIIFKDETNYDIVISNWFVLFVIKHIFEDKTVVLRHSTIIKLLKNIKHNNTNSFNFNFDFKQYEHYFN